MVKLEDLKVGQIVYLIYKYHWISEIIITKEMYKLKCADLNKSITYKVEANDGSYKRGLYKEDEENLFLNKEEAENVMCEYEMEQEQRWRNYFLLASDLFDKCKDIGCLTDADKRIIKKVLSEKY